LQRKLKTVAYAALAVLMLQGSGCQSARELGDLVIVMGIGMDSDQKNPENIKLTAQIVLPEKISSSQDGGASSSGSEGPYYNLGSSEKNTFEAVRGYTHMVSGKLYIAHAQVFVIGREMAQRRVAPVRA
jgi:spore germination protein KC